MGDFNENAEITDAALASLTTAVGAAGNCKIASGSYAGTGKSGSSSQSAVCSLSGTTLSWYHTSDAVYQLNSSSYSYVWVAIG